MTASQPIIAAMPETKTVHVGKLIEKLVENTPGMRKIDFAKAMHYSTSNVSSLFAREDWYLSKIVLASKILNHNILQHFVGTQDGATNIAMEESPVYLVGKQGEEIHRLTKDNELQKETIRQLLLTNRLLEDKVTELQLSLKTR
jgi:hypothetical protein